MKMAEEAIKKYKNKCWCWIRNAEEAMKKAGYGELLSAAALHEAPTKHAVVAQQRKGKCLTKLNAKCCNNRKISFEVL